MARKHTLVAALALGLAAVLGVVALGHTLGLGAASSHANDAVVVKRSHQLDRFEASLRRQLRNMPSVPAVAPAVAPPATPALAPPAAPSAAGAQRVIYVRPKPIVVTVHRKHGGDDGREAVSKQDGGGGVDD
jgi:hypothetical protein